MNLGSEQTEAERLEAVGIYPVSVNAMDWLVGDDSALEVDRSHERVGGHSPGLRRSGMKPFNRMEGGQ